MPFFCTHVPALPSSRRAFLRTSGLAVVSAAALAACGGTDAAEEAATTTTGPPEPTPDDLTTLRTATSLENLLVQVYTRAIDGGLLTTPAVLDAAKLFKLQHQEHAELLLGATINADGEPYEDPNPVLLGQITPVIASLRDERGVVQLLLDLEQQAVATYQASTGRFTATRFNETALAIGGVESRHTAVLAPIVGQPAAPKPFATPERAIAPV